MLVSAPLDQQGPDMGFGPGVNKLHFSISKEEVERVEEKLSKRKESKETLYKCMEITN